MRIGIMKLCSNVRFVSKECNGGSTEITVTINELMKLNHEINVLTIERYHKDAPQGCKCFIWGEIDKFIENSDVILCFNGVWNAYGGVASFEALASYGLLASAKKPIVYAVTDTAIPLADVDGWLRNSKNPQYHVLAASGAFKHDASKLYCLTQTYDTTAIKKIWNNPHNNFGAVGHAPFEMTVFFRKNLCAEISPETDCDLIYFGNPRGGKRDKKFFKYYFNQPKLKVDVYGNWDAEKITQKSKTTVAPNFHGKIDMYQLHGKINRALAHCYISDPQNEGTIWTTRFYEAVLNRTILFVDEVNDPFYVDSPRKFSDSFFYVNSKEELAEKILRLKADPEFRRKMLMHQLEDLSSTQKLILSSYGRIIHHHLMEATRFYAEHIQSKK